MQWPALGGTVWDLPFTGIPCPQAALTLQPSQGQGGQGRTEETGLQEVTGIKESHRALAHFAWAPGHHLRVTWFCCLSFLLCEMGLCGSRARARCGQGSQLSVVLRQGLSVASWGGQEGLVPINRQDKEKHPAEEQHVQKYRGLEICSGPGRPLGGLEPEWGCGTMGAGAVGSFPCAPVTVSGRSPSLHTLFPLPECHRALPELCALSKPKQNAAPLTEAFLTATKT